MPDELWMDLHDIVQETEIKTILKQKKCKMAKWLSEEALHMAMKSIEMKGKGEKEKTYLFECRVPKNICKASAYNEGEIRKPSSVINAKK